MAVTLDAGMLNLFLSFELFSKVKSSTILKPACSYGEKLHSQVWYISLNASDITNFIMNSSCPLF